MSFSFNCLIFGDRPDSCFTVHVPNVNSGRPLPLIREEIKKKKPIKLAHVDANKLDLRIVNWSFDGLETKLKDLKVEDCPPLLFSDKPTFPEDILHFIVVSPQPLKLKLNCAVEVEGAVALDDIFVVEVDITQLASELEVAIRKEPTLAHIKASRNLFLYKVSIPLDDGTPENIKVDLPLSNRLRPFMPLSQLCYNVPEDYLHIVVQDPTGERGRGSPNALYNRLERFISLFSEPTPPFESAKSLAYTKSLIADGRYKEDEPKTTVAPPIQLFHPVFARFFDDLKGTSNVPDDRILATLEYMRTSSAVFTSGERRRAKLTIVFSKILCLDPHTILDNEEIYVDGVVELPIDVGCFIMFMKEDEGELGPSGLDPTTQASLSIGRYWAQKQFENLRKSTDCPTFVVAISGSWIVVLGAVLTDGLIVQRLTDYIWVGLDSVLNEDRILHVAKTFHALKTGLENLKSYYGGVKLSSVSYAQSRYFPSICAYNNGRELVQFRYTGFLEDVPDCITLRARTRTTPPREIVVKFVNRYGERAHSLLAENGLAPELEYYGSPRLDDREPIYTSLFMVVMEYVKGQTLARSRLNEEEAEQVRRALEAALKLLHDNGLVFGDFRSPNVMITAKREVKIIDFDWAGEEGRARYPHFISSELSWPTGVKALATIERGHDLEMLKRMFSKPVPFITHS